MLELLVKGLVGEEALLLMDGPTVVEEAVLLVDTVELLGREAVEDTVLFVDGELLAVDALADEVVLFGKRVLLDGTPLVGDTRLVDDAVVPLDGTDDVGRLLLADDVPLEDTDEVGRLAVEETVLLGKDVEADTLLLGTEAVDDAEVMFEDGEDVGKLPVDDGVTVPLEETDDVGRLPVVDEAVLLLKGVEVDDTPLVEGPTEDVMLAEELTPVDDAVLFVTGLLLGMLLVGTIEDVGVTVPLLETGLVGTLVLEEEETVLLGKVVLVETPLLGETVDVEAVALVLAELLGTLPEDMGTLEVAVLLERELVTRLLVDAVPVDDATLVPLDGEIVDTLPVEEITDDEAVILLDEVEDAALGETGLDEAVPFVDETGVVLLVTLPLAPEDEGADVDVPLAEVAVLDTAEVGWLVPLEDEAGTLGDDVEAPVLVGTVALLADPEEAPEVALLAPDVVEADALDGALRLLVGVLVEAPPVTVTVTVTVTVVVEVEGVGVTVTVIGG